MTNKARQRSLQKKNGLNGGAEYCGYCLCRCFTLTSISINGNTNNMSGDGYYKCMAKENPEYKCAQAYNRMIRERRNKDD